MTRPPTAFVLSGGASFGAVEVGMLRALAEASIAPDILLGTSVGALNAAYVAGHPGTFPTEGGQTPPVSLRTRPNAKPKTSSLLA